MVLDQQIFWQVFSTSDGTLYSGDYETSMKFLYREKSLNNKLKFWIELDSAVALVPNYFEWYS